MAPKVKLFLVFLAIGAMLSVFSFFDIFGGVRSARFGEATKPILPPEFDTDQDGLSNSDESYWNTDFQNPDTDSDGYLDGEEVVSGYDPREAATHELGDSLSDTVFGSVEVIDADDLDDINLTDNVASLLAGGIAAGDIGRQADPDVSNSALAVLAGSAVDDFYKSLPLYNPGVLNVIDSTEENQLKYLESLAEIIKKDLLDTPNKLNLTENPFFQTDFFKARAEFFRVSRDNAAALNVPKNWLETHHKILDLLNRFNQNHAAIANYDQDAVKAIISFNDIESLDSQVKEIMSEIGEKIKTNGLQPTDTVFQVIKILN